MFVFALNRRLSAPAARRYRAGSSAARSLAANRARSQGGQIERHLEHRVDAQTGSVVAVLIARCDHHQPEADNIGKAVGEVFG